MMSSAVLSATEDSFYFCVNPGHDAMEEMLHGSQPYVARKLRNSSRPMLEPCLPASVPGYPVHRPSGRNRPTSDLMIIQVSGWVYPLAALNLLPEWVGASEPCPSTG